MTTPAHTYDPGTPVGQVRLLLNDVGQPWVFQDVEIAAILSLEGDSVKLAAAQLIDTNADNEALASKVLRTQDLQTDGAKLAQVLHARAQSLRDQVLADEEAEGFVSIVDTVDRGPCLPYDRGYRPELSGW